MRLAASQVDFHGIESQFARARRDVDVARATDDGVGLNGDLLVGRSVVQTTPEQVRHRLLFRWARKGRSLRDEERERQSAGSRRGRSRRALAPQQLKE